MDPWWHEVIVLTAGMRNVDAGVLVKALLRKNSDLATFLAAQGLETAIEIPLKTRKEVEKRLEGLIPPRTPRDADRLANLGLAAAPVLTKALVTSKEPLERFLLIYTLSHVDYEPAISALARIASDHRCVPNAYRYLDGCRIGPASLDLEALQSLARWAESSESAVRAFAQAAQQASDRAIETTRASLQREDTGTARRLLELLPDRATEARPGKSPSKGS
jgi:hypothetical protein